MIQLVGADNKNTSLLKTSSEIFGIAMIYAMFGWLGQSLAISPGNVTAVWPPSGFALAMVLLIGKRAWGGIWLGAFIINTQAFFDGTTIANTTASILAGFTIGAGSLIQHVVGAKLLQRFSEVNDFLQTVKSCLVFICVIPVMCLISSTIGTVSLYFAGFTSIPSFAELWVTWWLGDGVGVLILTPFLLTWFKQESFSLNHLQWVELTVVLFLLILFSFFGFDRSYGDGKSLFPIEFLIWPFLLWLALRFSNNLSISGMLTVCAIAIWKTTEGSGPFQLSTPNLSLLMLQLFLFITAAVISLYNSCRCDVYSFT